MGLFVTKAILGSSLFLRSGASGGLAPGAYTFANEGVWSAAFRIQRNFLP